MVIAVAERIRLRAAGEDGVGLVEVLVAMFLLAVALMALAQVATTGLFAMRNASDRTVAIGMATRAVEAARHLQWQELALDGGVHAGTCGTAVPIDSAGTLNEPVVCSSEGAVGNTPPFWGPDESFELQTYVTSVVDVPNARRVTAIVTWQERTGAQEARTSTVIAQVDRG